MLTSQSEDVSPEVPKTSAASTLAEVTDWIATTGQRHAKLSDSECACGWVAIGDVTWSQHRPYYPLDDLQDIVPSSWRDGTRALPTSEVIEILTVSLDKAHEDIELLREALAMIATGRVEGDIREYALGLLEKT